jgi:hypothetical protein
VLGGGAAVGGSVSGHLLGLERLDGGEREQDGTPRLKPVGALPR